MQGKREPVLDEEPTHKKKSAHKGRPRSKHKHTYETVLLTYNYSHGSDESRKISITIPTKVCIICGRVDKVNSDESYYIKEPDVSLPIIAYKKELSKKALALPKWYTNDGKIAMRY